ncbi:hypothetical protein Tco_1408270 [Tanacetum coccineum]
MTTREKEHFLSKKEAIFLLLTGIGDDIYSTVDACKTAEIINEGRVDQYPEQCQVKSHMLDLSSDNQTTDYSKQSLESENILLKKIVAQFQKDFSRMEAHLNIELEHNVAKLRKENETLKKHYKDLYDSIKITRSKTIEHTTSLLANNADLIAQIQEKVLRKPVLQSLRNQSVVRQPNAFKSERPQMSKPRLASQVDVNNNLSRPVTHHYLPKRRESDFAKPNHMFASSKTRNSSKSMPRFRSNDMVLPKSDHSKSSSSFSDSKHFVCSTCHKCVFNANHDACITKLLKEVNSHAKIQSHKTRNSNKPVDQKSHTQKPGRQIFTRHRFSPNKTSAVYEKTSPRSDLRWKPTGRIFKSVGLRWIPTGKLFDSCTSKDDSEPTHGSNVDIPNIHESKQTLDLSAGTSINVQKEQGFDLSAVVSKSSAVIAADVSVTRQQQPYSTSSTSTLATTVTADGNFDFTPVQEQRQKRSHGSHSISDIATEEMLVYQLTHLRVDFSSVKGRTWGSVGPGLRAAIDLLSGRRQGVGDCRVAFTAFFVDDVLLVDELPWAAGEQRQSGGGWGGAVDVYSRRREETEDRARREGGVIFPMGVYRVLYIIQSCVPSRYGSLYDSSVTLEGGMRWGLLIKSQSCSGTIYENRMAHLAGYTCRFEVLCFECLLVSGDVYARCLDISLQTQTYYSDKCAIHGDISI